MNYVVSGVVPTPMYDPHNSFYQYERGGEPIVKAKQIGDAGRVISVVTTNKKIAEQIATIFRAVFENVTVSKKA